MTKDWSFNQPLESKSENQEDPDKIEAYLEIIKEVMMLIIKQLFKSENKHL